MQQIHVPPLPAPVIADYLVNTTELAPAQAEVFGRLSEGSLVHARQLMEVSEENSYYFEKFIFLMRKAYVKNIVDLKSWSEELAALGREQQKSFLQYGQRMIRENFILNIRQADQLNYMNEEEASFSTKFSPFIHEKNILLLMNELGTAQLHVEQNVNGKMIFFDLCLKIIMLLKG